MAVNGIYSTAGRLAGSFKGLKLPTASYSGDKNPRCQQRLPETLVFFSSKEPSDSTALPSTERLRGYTTFGDECRDGWSEFCLECNNKFGDQLLCCETDNCPRAYCLHCAKETKARENFFFLLKYVSCITEHFTDSKE